MLDIHPTSVVDRSVIVGDDIVIGPNCYVGPKVKLGDRCRLHNNVTIIGKTTVGADNIFFPGSVIGAAPQDLKYRGEETELVIGDDNIFRENVTVHLGTEVAGGVTRIGNHNRFLVSAHIAHDVVIGNQCILANCVQLAGHVHIEDRVTMGGLIGVHHFVTIGTLSYIGGLTRLTADAPPFMITAGYDARVRGVNAEGMKRWGYAPQRIQTMRDVFKQLYSQRATAGGRSVLERIETLESNGLMNEDIRHLCDFVKRSSREGIYGRHLESKRTDTDDDRKSFYNTADNGSDANDAEMAEEASS